ncbi:MAG: hypothetical protein ACREDZ_17550 [Kiloniellales bacterium]
MDRYLRDLGIGEPGTRLALVAEIFLRASCSWQASRTEDLTDVALRQTHWVLFERVKGLDMSRKQRGACDIAQALLLIALEPRPRPAEFANGHDQTAVRWPSDALIGAPPTAPMEMWAKPFEYSYGRSRKRQSCSAECRAVDYGLIPSTLRS